MPLPTPEEVRQLYIKLGIKPARTVFGIKCDENPDGEKYIPNGQKKCCVLGLLAIGLTRPTPDESKETLSHDCVVAVARKYATYCRDLNIIIHEFDNCTSPYWEAVKDLV